MQDLRVAAISTRNRIGQPIRDNQSGYRLISRRLLEAILTSDEAGFEFEVEMIVTCVQHGFKLDWVPIRTIYLDAVADSTASLDMVVPPEDAPRGFGAFHGMPSSAVVDELAIYGSALSAERLQAHRAAALGL